MCEARGLRDEAMWSGRGLITSDLWGLALSKYLIPGQWSDMVRYELENGSLDSLTRVGTGEGQPGVVRIPASQAWAGTQGW